MNSHVNERIAEPSFRERMRDDHLGLHQGVDHLEEGRHLGVPFRVGVEILAEADDEVCEFAVHDELPA